MLTFYILTLHVARFLHEVVQESFKVFHLCSKGKAIPLQAWTDPEAPRFQDVRHMKVVMLSALRTSHVYPPGSIPGILFC